MAMRTTAAESAFDGKVPAGPAFAAAARHTGAAKDIRSPQAPGQSPQLYHSPQLCHSQGPADRLDRRRARHGRAL